MPSQFIYDIAYIIVSYFTGESVTTLLNMQLEQFFDLAIYSINSANERKDKDDMGDYVNNVTTPTPIKNGGWF